MNESCTVSEPVDQFWSALEKPLAVTRTEPAPCGTESKEKVPSLDVLVDDVNPPARNVTPAFAMLAPLLSLTEPEIVSSWAEEGEGNSRAKNEKMTITQRCFLDV